jgi:hypothetical protein
MMIHAFGNHIQSFQLRESVQNTGLDDLLGNMEQWAQV